MKTSHSIILLFSIISFIGFGLTSLDLMKFAFAQSDENVMNQTDSEDFIGSNVTSTAGSNVTSTAGSNVTSTAGSNVTSTAGSNVTSTAGLNVTSTAIPTPSESYSIEYIIAGIAIIVIGIGIAIALSKKKKVPTTKKGSTSKKFCRKCGTSLDTKSKFCGKCGVSITPKKNKQ